MKICGMKVNHLPENLTAGPENPVFGWRVEGPEKNIRQLGCRVQVWQEDGQACWDSGYMESSRMTGIPYQGEALTAGSAYSWRVECRMSWGDGSSEAGGDGWADGQITVIAGASSFETGLFGPEDWKGCFIGETKDHVYHLYRKVFYAGAGLKKARLYICALGHFEGWINGRKVSDHVLEPGWSDYNKTCFYTAYDVTGLLREGDNALTVKPGDGMFHVPGGRYVYYERSYGRCKFLAQLELLFEDGRRQQIVTDESWRMTESPIRFCCIYGGEDYDGRLMRKEYLAADYREGSQWVPVQRVEPPRGKLTAMPMEPMKVMRRYEPVKVTKVSADTWLYDLGANFSGWVRIRLRTDGRAAGRLVSMKPGEILGPDGRVDQQMTRQKYLWNYILSQEEQQEFAPDFTYTGFRYVEVTGAEVREGAVSEETGAAGSAPGKEESARDGLVVLEGLTGEFLYPDLEQGGEFECSNGLFNGIHGIVLQAILSNTKSYFTDCPHREKLGWLEQVHLIGPSIMYNLQVQNLYSKIEQDMADSQRENGLVPDICPEYVTGFGRWHEGFVDSPEWGSACILGPWYAYKRYGDLEMLRRFYVVMKRYLDYLGSRTHHEVLHHGLGDWLDIGPCTPHSQNTPVPVVATCVYYYDLDVMRQIAELLGCGEDAREYGARMEAVFAEYNLQFLDSQTGRYATGSQAAQAMSLVAGLAPEKMQEKIIRQLREDVEKRGFAVTAGDVGHPFLVAALMKYGMTDLLNEMTNLTDTPGYGYQVVNGATSLTEEWDGPDPARPHGSQNHLMLGSIEEWFYGSLGGIDLIRGRSTLEEITIAPRPEKGVDWVKAWTLHPYGRISVEWKREDGQVQVKVLVPPNVTAHLKRPDGTEAAVVGSGCYSYSFSSGGE